MIVELELKDLTIPQGLLPRILTGTVEEKVEEYKEMLEQGVEFDPITVWKRPDGYWIVDGVHRTEAHKRAMRTTIKAKIVELKDELEYRLETIRANLRHGLPLQKEEKILLAQMLHRLGVSIPELKKLFGVAERTLYHWLQPVKEKEKKEKEELKTKALELRRQGMSLREIAESLGAPKSTIEDWVNEGVRNLQKLQISDSPQLLSPDGTPTSEGFKALSEFIEENEEELISKPFNEVVKEPALRDILKYLNESVKRDFRRLIDAPSYDKVKNYLITIYPYKELSLRARKMFFDKAQTLWESLRKEYEERKKLESLVLEKAKEVLSKPDYRFHSWRTLRVDLFRMAGLHQTFGKEELIDDILREHADELLTVYKQIKEATEDSLTEEELREIILAVAQKAEEIDVRFSLDKVEQRIIEALVQKSLRADYSVVNKLRKKAEELAKQMIKDHPLIMRWWMLNYSQEALKKIDEIDIDIEISDEDIEELKQMYENMKATQAEKKKEKKEKSLPDMEDWYRKQLELLMIDMGIKLGWVKAFEIADEVYKNIREYSQKATRGW